MKPSTFFMLIAAAFIVLGSTTYAQGSTSDWNGRYCGPNNIRCMDGYSPMCSHGNWTCVRNASSSSRSSSSTSALPYCFAQCPDGYRYRVCSEDGQPIYYFADPCMNHYGSSSSSRSSSSSSSSSSSTSSFSSSSSSSSRSSSNSSNYSCGPNPILCPPWRVPVCTGGNWICSPYGMSSSSSSVSLKVLQITSLNPSSVRTGAWVTIEGKGFARRNNTVFFANSIIPNLQSWNGTELTFRVPSSYSQPCTSWWKRCESFLRRYSPGKYNVWVRANGKVSNTLKLRIK